MTPEEECRAALERYNNDPARRQEVAEQVEELIGSLMPGHQVDSKSTATVLWGSTPHDPAERKVKNEKDGSGSR